MVEFPNEKYPLGGIEMEKELPGFFDQLFGLVERGTSVK